MDFAFDRVHLTALAGAHRAQYAAAAPFPHVVFDAFLPAEVAARLVDEFPSPAPNWTRYDRPPLELNKSQLSEESVLPPFTRKVVWAFNSAVFLRFLTELTGIKGLVADPSLWGGGLHQTERGGWLAVHADFYRHPELELDRRINVLLFLNPDWPAEWGGALEFWARDMSTCVQRIPPVLNRCVIFSTTDWAFHGQPDPLACPDDVPRRSLALYYYTNGRPPAEVIPRLNSPVFRRRPGTREAHNLLSLRIKYYLLRCIPPIAIDLKRHLVERLSEWQSSEPDRPAS
jgi:hypothetical protein